MIKKIGKNILVEDNSGRKIYEGEDRRMNGNGYSKTLVMWLLGAIFALFLLVAKYSLAESTNKYDSLSKVVFRLSENINTDGNRITAVEVFQIELSKKADSMDKKLDVILQELTKLKYQKKDFTVHE